MKRRPTRVSWYSKFLSELLAQLRAHVGLSPKELSERAGISPHTIGTCERYCGRLSIDKIFRYIEGVGFDSSVVFYEVSERLDLAGKPSKLGKNPRPGVAFKMLYDAGIIDRSEVNRQLRMLRKLRKPATKRSAPVTARKRKSSTQG
jgi:DNA-binding XRE family transcriptional regulator